MPRILLSLFVLVAVAMPSLNAAAFDRQAVTMVGHDECCQPKPKVEFDPPAKARASCCCAPTPVVMHPDTTRPVHEVATDVTMPVASEMPADMAALVDLRPSNFIDRSWAIRGPPVPPSLLAQHTSLLL